MFKIELISSLNSWELFTAEAVTFLLEDNTVKIRSQTTEITWEFEDIDLLSVDKETFIYDGQFIGIGSVNEVCEPSDHTNWITEELNVFEVEFEHGKILHFPLIEIDDGEQNR